MKMLKQLFGTRMTTRMDVILAAGAAVMAVANFVNVRQQYNDQQQDNNEENQA